MATLYFGERTFYPIHSAQRASNLSPRHRQTLLTSQRRLLLAYFAGMILYLALFAVSKKSSFYFKYWVAAA